MFTKNGVIISRVELIKLVEIRYQVFREISEDWVEFEVWRLAVLDFLKFIE